MNLFLDPLTRHEVANAGELFLRPSYPASACFNGYNLDKKFTQKVHINPAEAVKLTHNKTALMQALNMHGVPVPTFADPAKMYTRDGSFNLESYTDKFPETEDGFVRFIARRVQSQIQDLADLMNVLNLLKNHQQGSVFQKATAGEVISTVTAIPNAPKRLFTGGKEPVTNGVLSDTLPSFVKDKDEVFELVLKAIDHLDLDYATATVSTSEEGIKVIDINTNLHPEHAIAIRSMMDKMSQASATKKK